jgi:hypothetical protein
MSALNLPRRIDVSAVASQLWTVAPRLLKREDEDVSDEVRLILEAEGVEGAFVG